MSPENNRQLPFSINETKRPISIGAEKRLGEVIPVLDHGFIYLVDYMGNDNAIEDAARVSYGTGTRKANETRGLIRYLRRHEHTTPFEMVEFKFHAKMPIFVARQWVRHRTANINEYSARYSILDKEFYIPEPEVLASQSKTNRQGRGNLLDPTQAEAVRQLLFQDSAKNYEDYQFMLNDDGTGKPVDPDRDMVARELARMNLSLNFYTQWYWKIDLHNLFHFVGLRADDHAQYEIRVYADAMSEIIHDAVPLAWEAYVDYQLEAVRLSRLEKEVIANLLKQRGILETDEVFSMAKRVGLTGKGEIQEMMSKFKKAGFLGDK